MDLRMTTPESAPTAGPDSLSPKELEVIRLLASGLSLGEIARSVNRSKQTVTAQKIAAMRKLGLGDDAALHAYMREHGLLL
jgi:two-component system capsular synthesis response regulator RcsB